MHSFYLLSNTIAFCALSAQFYAIRLLELAIPHSHEDASELSVYPPRLIRLMHPFMYFDIQDLKPCVNGELAEQISMILPNASPAIYSRFRWPILQKNSGMSGSWNTCVLQLCYTHSWIRLTRHSNYVHWQWDAALPNQFKIRPSGSLIIRCRWNYVIQDNFLKR